MPWITPAGPDPISKEVLRMNVEQMKCMLWAVDMDRAVAFYRDAIGLTVRMESPYWSELEKEGFVLALHGGADEGRRKSGLGIQVEDIEAAVAEAAEAGATVLAPPKCEGAVHLAGLVDPEGNEFTFSQPAG